MARAHCAKYKINRHYLSPTPVAESIKKNLTIPQQGSTKKTEKLCVCVHIYTEFECVSVCVLCLCNICLHKQRGRLRMNQLVKLTVNKTGQCICAPVSVFASIQGSVSVCKLTSSLCQKSFPGT